MRPRGCAATAAAATRLAARLASLATLLLGIASAEQPEAVPPPDASPATAAPPVDLHGDHPPVEPPPSEAPPSTTPARPSDEGETWIDESHRYLERELGGLVERFDSFFGEERPLDLDPPGSVVRWRSEGRADERGHLGFRTAVLADVRLPAAQRWLSRTRLVFAGESTADPARPYTEDAGNPGFSPSIKAEQAHLELRQVLVKRTDTNLDAGAGVRIRILPDPFARIRFRQHLELGAKFEARFGETAFWQRKDGFGESTQLDFARPVAAHTVLRWNNGANLSEISSGLEWATELGVGHEFTSVRTAFWVAGAMTGHTRPQNDVTGYRAYTRLRRDVWRRWLFLELEPEVAWPLEPPHGYVRVFAFTLRFEVHFDGRAVPAVAAPGAGNGR